MSDLDFSGFAARKPLKDILAIPPRVESVYSLTQHVWAGSSDKERQESKKNNKVRLETLDEFFLDPVRSYLHRILEQVAAGTGQGFWLQAEFGVGKSHLLAATSVIVVGHKPAWDKVKEREDEEGKSGPGARLDNQWRKKLENKKIFPIVFSLEGCGGSQGNMLEDFILEEAQVTFGLREGKPLAVYPEEHLARLYLQEHQKSMKDDLRAFLADPRLMRGLGKFTYDEMMDALKNPAAQKDAGRVLMAFYRHKKLTPKVATERAERLRSAIRDILDAGYDGVFIVIDEMSEYLRRSQHAADDEDCLLTLSSTLAKAEGLPVWTLVAAQAAHTNPKKIIGPDRLREELLEHKNERFRNIVIQRTRRITNEKEVELYYAGYSSLLPWVKALSKDEFIGSFPFPPDAIDVLRKISTRLTGTRSTISFLHHAVKKAADAKEKDLVPLWKVFDDLMSYNETPSTASHGAISIRSGFRNEVAALEAAQATLKRITDGQLARPQNRSRAERILNTLFLYYLAGVQGLMLEQILDAVCDIKPNEETIESQKGHYGTILEEMCAKLRNQVRKQSGRFEFIPKETSHYDDMVFIAVERLKADPEQLRQLADRLIGYSDPTDPRYNSPFAEFVSVEDWQRTSLTLKDWHGQERSGRVTIADLSKGLGHIDLDDEDDFLIILARRSMTDKAVEKLLKREGKPVDPRVVVWAPAEIDENEKAILAGVGGHLLVADENRDNNFGKEGAREFRRDAHRAYNVLVGAYSRGLAKTSRTTLAISTVGGVDGSLSGMAGDAMDTCYESRSLDFGTRRFDKGGAVKLINGLVKLDVSVSEGDQLWSAVENFAPVLGLVRPEAPKFLDPDSGPFYKKIRDKIVGFGKTGIEVRTVYNWFTGYRPEDGNESPGLTPRMVDVYLLAMARKGIVRISVRRGVAIDRNTIANIDFKPETLRGLERIDLPRPLEDWNKFHGYLEVLLSRRKDSLGAVPEGSIGALYDRAKADEALRKLWDDSWINESEVLRVDEDLKCLFGEISIDNPFTELLVYWLDFSAESKPEQYDDREMYQCMCRTVLKVTGAGSSDSLTPEHLATFKKNFNQFGELRDSFEKTRSYLLRAARLAVAPIPEAKEYKELSRLQQDVHAQLEKAKDLVVSPDTVNARLVPRLDALEKMYIPAFVDATEHLSDVQASIWEYVMEARKGNEINALSDFTSDVAEAGASIAKITAVLDGAPAAIRPVPDSRDDVERDLKREVVIRAQDKTIVDLRRLTSDTVFRRNALPAMKLAVRDSLEIFVGFLRSPAVATAIEKAAETVPDAMKILRAKSDRTAAEALVDLSSKERKELAKRLKTALGHKKQKTVRLADFKPQNATVWERKDIDAVVDQFKSFIDKEWDDDSYLRLE